MKKQKDTKATAPDQEIALANEIAALKEEIKRLKASNHSYKSQNTLLRKRLENAENDLILAKADCKKANDLYEQADKRIKNMEITLTSLNCAAETDYRQKETFNNLPWYKKMKFRF